MSDDLDQLADEFWEETLRFQPTNRHMLGDYSDVGSWEHASREAEQAHAADAARAGGPGRGGRPDGPR